MVGSVKRKFSSLMRGIAVFVTLTFTWATVLPSSQVFAQTSLNLPAPGTMIAPTQAFSPALIKGLTIDAKNPLEFDFLVSKGQTMLEGEALREESLKLVKYFMAALTVPEQEMWVNLSPYEKDRIMSTAFGITEMGRDLLAQDYMLKQLSASLMYPEKELGAAFWEVVYRQPVVRHSLLVASENESTAPATSNQQRVTDLLHKIWIVPDKAVIYENAETRTAYIVESHLKVMVEEDYVARRSLLVASQDNSSARTTSNEQQATDIIRQILIPAIEKEVNTGETFANLRQIYSAMILATWYKNNLRESILGRVYVNQNKVTGIDLEDKNIKQKIYQQYLEAFRKGVYNYIKEDYDPVSQQIIPRKYFSGGFDGAMLNKAVETRQELTVSDRAQLAQDAAQLVRVDAAMLDVGDADKAMMSRLQKAGTGVVIAAATLLGLSCGPAGCAAAPSNTGAVSEVEEIKPVSVVAAIDRYFAEQRREDSENLVASRRKSDPVLTSIPLIGSLFNITPEERTHDPTYSRFREGLSLLRKLMVNQISVADLSPDELRQIIATWQSLNRSNINEDVRIIASGFNRVVPSVQGRLNSFEPVAALPESDVDKGVSNAPADAPVQEDVSSAVDTSNQQSEPQTQPSQEKDIAASSEMDEIVAGLQARIDEMRRKVAIRKPQQSASYLNVGHDDEVDIPGGGVEFSEVSAGLSPIFEDPFGNLTPEEAEGFSRFVDLLFLGEPENPDDAASWLARAQATGEDVMASLEQRMRLQSKIRNLSIEVDPDVKTVSIAFDDVSPAPGERISIQEAFQTAIMNETLKNPEFYFFILGVMAAGYGVIVTSEWAGRKMKMMLNEIGTKVAVKFSEASNPVASDDQILGWDTQRLVADMVQPLRDVLDRLMAAHKNRARVFVVTKTGEEAVTVIQAIQELDSRRNANLQPGQEPSFFRLQLDVLVRDKNNEKDVKDAITSALGFRSRGDFDRGGREASVDYKVYVGVSVGDMFSKERSVFGSSEYGPYDFVVMNDENAIIDDKGVDQRLVQNRLPVSLLQKDVQTLLSRLKSGGEMLIRNVPAALGRIAELDRVNMKGLPLVISGNNVRSRFTVSVSSTEVIPAASEVFAPQVSLFEPARTDSAMTGEEMDSEETDFVVLANQWLDDLIKDVDFISPIEAAGYDINDLGREDPKIWRGIVIIILADILQQQINEWIVGENIKVQAINVGLTPSETAETILSKIQNLPEEMRPSDTAMVASLAGDHESLRDLRQTLGYDLDDVVEAIDYYTQNPDGPLKGPRYKLISSAPILDRGLSEDQRRGAIKILQRKGDSESLQVLQLMKLDFPEFFSDESENETSQPMVQQPVLADAAQLGKDDVGGIDLNPAMLDMQIKRDGKGIPLPLDQQPLDNINIQGFLPVIINITPVQNLPMLLGVADPDPADNGSNPVPQISLGPVNKYGA